MRVLDLLQDRRGRGAGTPAYIQALEAALARKPADAGVLGAGGITALHVAAAKNSAAAVPLLMSAGADAKAVVQDGRAATLPGFKHNPFHTHETPLVLACRLGHPETVEALLAAGAEPSRAAVGAVHNATSINMLAPHARVYAALLRSGLKPNIEYVLHQRRATTPALEILLDCLQELRSTTLHIRAEDEMSIMAAAARARHRPALLASLSATAPLLSAGGSKSVLVLESLLNWGDVQAMEAFVQEFTPHEDDLAEIAAAMRAAVETGREGAARVLQAAGMQALPLMIDVCFAVLDVGDSLDVGWLEDLLDFSGTHLPRLSGRCVALPAGWADVLAEVEGMQVDFEAEPVHVALASAFRELQYVRARWHNELYHGSRKARDKAQADIDRHAAAHARIVEALLRAGYTAAPYPKVLRDAGTESDESGWETEDGYGIDGEEAEEEEEEEAEGGEEGQAFLDQLLINPEAAVMNPEFLEYMGQALGLHAAEIDALVAHAAPQVLPPSRRLWRPAPFDALEASRGDMWREPELKLVWMAAAQQPWDPDSHRHFPATFKDAVRALLLCAQRGGRAYQGGGGRGGGRGGRRGGRREGVGERDGVGAGSSCAAMQLHLLNAGAAEFVPLSARLAAVPPPVLQLVFGHMAYPISAWGAMSF